MNSTDQQQRLQAIDVTCSCIVQAPAGSGKTELLIQRLLALLGVVEKPQQILAITFTNKAAAEMRRRLLEALSCALTEEQPQQDHAALTWRLARQALDRQGEILLLNPSQLAIQTIDSLCATIVRKMPWATRFGGMPEISEDATELYETAVQRLLDHLERPGSVSDALQILLQHLDNDMALVQRMLVALLGRRDQWLRHLTADRQKLHAELNAVLENICDEHLDHVNRTIPADLVEELVVCADFAAQHCPEEAAVGHCRGFTTLPAATMEQLPCWCGFAELVLTSSGSVRKTVNKNIGFPPGTEYKADKRRMLNLLADLEHVPGLVPALHQLRQLPRRLYSDQQWQLLEVFFDLLPRLVAELWLVFRDRGQTDFTEIALKANQALGEADDPSDLLLQLDHQFQHILVDEFQDTSRLQYQLFSTLTSGWTDGDGRTLFLVGDPMQSIYRFREAEVGLFLNSFGGVFGSAELPMKALRLSCNFRSQQKLVDWANEVFVSIFPQHMDITSGAVAATTAQAVKPSLADRAVRVHPFADVDDQAEAEQIVDLILSTQAQDPEQTIAVLVRGRSHLRHLLPLLRQRGIAYQAKDIEQLEARPAVLDIVHLARALVHRGDRLAWTAVLRAPWCGLTLTDLTMICQFPLDRTIPSILSDSAIMQSVSDDGRRRIERVRPILQRGMAARGQRPLRDLVEGCWLALGGPVGMADAALNDADMIFELIEKLDQGGDIKSFDQLARQLRQLYSPPDSRASDKLQIMTIHKAKGLQFDTVILPGLGKKTRHSDTPLLRWLEHPQHGLLLAPVSERGSREKDPIYQLVAGLEETKDDHESARLLYVAVTRAIRRLHLLGHAVTSQDQQLRPAKGSLLEKLWPHVAHYYEHCRHAATQVTLEENLPVQQRLKGDWKLPDVAAVPLVAPLSERGASTVDDIDLVDDLYSGWEKSMYRHVGTLIHQFFERIARFGDASWKGVPAAQLLVHIRQSLRRLGVRQVELDDATNKVRDAVSLALSSHRGRWLLFPHQHQASELALSGFIDGQIVHAIIDRTFVDQGVRWVVDYKTSIPAPGADLDAFLLRESLRYQRQMLIYLELIKQYDPYHEAKGALYFPLIDGWQEIQTAT
ncbi:MAG: UvrD-helicase domain-containing protein [Pelovirga sp.]